MTDEIPDRADIIASDIEHDEAIGRISKYISRIVAIVLAALLAAYFTVTINNMVTVNNQIEVVKNGAYPVSVAAGRVETLLVQMRTIDVRPTYAKTEQMADTLRYSYSVVYDEIEEPLRTIEELHLDDPSITDSLMDNYNELVTLQSDYLGMVSDAQVDIETIHSFAFNRLLPLIDEMLDLDKVVLDDSSAVVDTMYTTVIQAVEARIYTSIGLLIAVAAATVIFLWILHVKNEGERKLRASLEDAYELARSANMAKTSFLSNMSHDIRTPMNAIVGLTAIASSHLDEPERVKECLARISTSSRHLLSLINDVLDMGKIESGKITINEERFSFPALVREFVTIVQPQAKAKRLKFDVIISNIDQEMVIGDTLRINQILLNLIGNAIKYTREGDSVKVSISEEHGNTAGWNNYRFVVQDTGIGMSPEFLERIFDPFERESKEIVNFTEGAGLGMPITKNVVELMNGTIDVQSEEGKGTTVTVVLPLKVSPDEEEEYDVTGLKDLHVLVVDDDHDVLENTLSILEDFSMRGEISSSGIDAVALTVQAHADKDDFRAIIVDWIMPGMDGLETVRQIRLEVGDATPIILLSAYDWSDIEDQALEAGVSAFIAKPLFKSRLYHVLRDVCVPHDSAEKPKKAHGKPQVKGRVLLVEDNELNMEIARELIEQFGASVDEAVDGVEALKLVDEKPEGYYSLIFMDWQMPRMNGIEATKNIIEHENLQSKRHTPIVAMTANAFNEDKEQALAVGMDGFMAKPINMSELEYNLKTYLEPQASSGDEAPADEVSADEPSKPEDDA